MSAYHDRPERGMNEMLDPGTRRWAIVAVILGAALFLGIEWLVEPNQSLATSRSSCSRSRPS